MKTFKTSIWAAALIVMCVFASCATKTNLNYRVADTSLTTASFDGRCEVRVQGRGMSARDAYVNACQKAVHEILFKNRVYAQGERTNVEAIFDDATIEKQNEAYFQRFFSAGGAYEQFLIGNKFLGNRHARRELTRNSTTYCYEATLVVDRLALKEYMRREGFLK